MFFKIKENYFFRTDLFHTVNDTKQHVFTKYLTNSQINIQQTIDFRIALVCPGRRANFEILLRRCLYSLQHTCDKTKLSLQHSHVKQNRHDADILNVTYILYCQIERRMMLSIYGLFRSEPHYLMCAWLQSGKG